MRREAPRQCHIRMKPRIFRPSLDEGRSLGPNLNAQKPSISAMTWPAPWPPFVETEGRVTNDARGTEPAKGERLAYDLPCQAPLRRCERRIPMSLAATRQAKLARNACQTCRGRKARFGYRGSARADRDHTLCFECYRSG